MLHFGVKLWCYGKIKWPSVVIAHLHFYSANDKKSLSSVVPYDSNKWVFNRRLNCPRLSDCLSSVGSATIHHHHQNTWTMEVCCADLILLVWPRPAARSHSWWIETVESSPICCSQLVPGCLRGLLSDYWMTVCWWMHCVGCVVLRRGANGRLVRPVGVEVDWHQHAARLSATYWPGNSCAHSRQRLWRVRVADSFVHFWHALLGVLPAQLPGTHSVMICLIWRLALSTSQC